MGWGVKVAKFSATKNLANNKNHNYGQKGQKGVSWLTMRERGEGRCCYIHYTSSFIRFTFPLHGSTSAFRRRLRFLVLMLFILSRYSWLYAGVIQFDPSQKSFN